MNSSMGAVVTGVGVVTPFGTNTNALETALREGRSAIARIERFDTSSRHAHHAALIDDFRPKDFIEPNRMRRMDPLSTMAVAAAKLAMDDAGLGPRDPRRPDPATGVAFGTSLGCQATTLRYAAKLVEQGARTTNPIDFPDSIDGAPAAHVAMALGLQGVSTTHMDGALSGELALLHAVLALQFSRAEVMLVGSGDLLTPTLHGILDDLGLLCRSESSPPMCPYDKGLRGPVPGEGVAFVVLESVERARRRGARIYAEVLGIGLAVDPACVPYRFPRDVATPRTALRRALSHAACSTNEVDLFSGSAASHSVLDALELETATRELETAKPWLVTLKANWGESDGSGILRLVGASLALHAGFVPPCVALEAPVVRTHLPWTREPVEQPIRRVLHMTLARGGQSLCLVLGRS